MIKYHYRIRPLKIKFVKINRDEKDLEISSIIIPERVIAPHGFGKEFDHRRISIAPNKSYVLDEWLINPLFFNSDFGTGDVEFRAELYMKKTFLVMLEHKLDSAQVTVNYKKPQGKDAEAFTIITSRYVFFVKNYQYDGPAFINSGPIPSEYDLNNFLDKYNDTCYAPYVKYSIAICSQTVVNELEDLIGTAPKDFPLLPEIYIYLLRYYYNENDLTKMWELSQSILVDELNIHNPEKKEELVKWIKKILWWQPDTSKEQEITDKAFNKYSGKIWGRLTNIYSNIHSC
ncbi:MAG: hypothetical protein JW787_09445 [Sedimentisphaerales bacterium]|nr:hypothetical protein [Sedimentisphaerales bacterium]